jgi:cell division protein FtsZ
MVMPGLINLDFADIRAVMGEMGKAMMGTGEAEGDRRAIDAAEAAISNPLLEDVSMKGARGVLINITGGADMTLFEVDEAANRIREEVDPEANIIFGSTFDEKLAGRMRISVVATGIDVAVSARPLLSLVGDRDMPSASVTAAQAPPAALPGALPIAASVAAPAALSGGDAEPAPAAAQAAENAALHNGAFLAPRAVEPAVARPIPAPVAASDAFAAAAMENGGRPALAKVKARGPSLFERVTGVGRLRAAAPERAAPERAARPAAPAAQQPRLGALDPGDRLVGSKNEEDLLDIPAFLRRQAN